MTTLAANAQPATRTRPWESQIALDAGVQFPGGGFSDAYSLGTGYGFSANYYYQLLSRNTFISLGVGFNSFNSGNGTNTSVTVVPVLFGMRYNFSITGFQPYIGVELGAYIRSIKPGGTTVTSSTTDFGLMPKLGARIPLAAQLDFDMSLKYHTILASGASFSFLGLNFGIAYTI
jgi:hypothetical protein